MARGLEEKQGWKELFVKARVRKHEETKDEGVSSYPHALLSSGPRVLVSSINAAGGSAGAA